MITLRPYQQVAADRLRHLLLSDSWAYLIGEVRTGKTLTALEVARQLHACPVLVLTKKKAIASIERDVDSLGLEGVTVTNFEQAHKMGDRCWNLLILDEAHCCGSYPRPSLRFRQISHLLYQRCLLMSGTPSPESLSQLYHQIRIATTTFWPQANFYRWSAAGYVSVTTKRIGNGQEANDYSAANAERILAELEPHVVRITQADAGFACRIIEQDHYVRMSPLTYQIMRAVSRDGIYGTYGDEVVILADGAAQQMAKLRQLASGTCITADGDGIILDRSKARWIQERFGNGGRLAILYCYQAEGQMLRQMWGAAATDSPERFAEDLSSVFIGQVMASREGVNLSPADDLVFLGVDYSALSYLQGRDRASAVGRSVPPRVHWVLAADSLEREVIDRVRRKESYTAAHYRQARERLSGRSH